MTRAVQPLEQGPLPQRPVATIMIALATYVGVSGWIKAAQLITAAAVIRLTNTTIHKANTYGILLREEPFTWAAPLAAVVFSLIPLVLSVAAALTVFRKPSRETAA